MNRTTHASKNRLLVSVSELPLVKRLRQSSKCQAQVITLPRPSLGRIYLRTPWEQQTPGAQRKKNKLSSQDLEITTLNLASQRTKNPHSRLVLRHAVTWPLKRRNTSKPVQASMILFQKIPNLRQLAGELALRLALEWSKKDKIKSQVLARTKFLPRLLMVLKSACMLKLTKLIKISKRTYLDQVNTTFRTTLDRKTQEHLPTLLVVATESTWPTLNRLSSYLGPTCTTRTLT